jgi:hypothetical protein
MTLRNRVGMFPKTLPTATLSRLVNDLVNGSSLLAAAVRTDHVLYPEARSDVRIQCYGLVRAAGPFDTRAQKHADDDR